MYFHFETKQLIHVEKYYITTSNETTSKELGPSYKAAKCAGTQEVPRLVNSCVPQIFFHSPCDFPNLYQNYSSVVSGFCGLSSKYILTFTVAITSLSDFCFYFNIPLRGLPMPSLLAAFIKFVWPPK
jgi:hypothetical protein